MLEADVGLAGGHGGGVDDDAGELVGEKVEVDDGARLLVPVDAWGEKVRVEKVKMGKGMLRYRIRRVCGCREGVC